MSLNGQFSLSEFNYDCSKNRDQHLQLRLNQHFLTVTDIATVYPYINTALTDWHSDANKFYRKYYYIIRGYRVVHNVLKERCSIKGVRDVQ